MLKDNRYIFVDLDGTLINTDLLFETALRFLKKNPLNIFLLFIWLLKGKSILKSELAERIDIDVSLLPYQDELIEYLNAEKNKGRKLILATASHKKYADNVAKHLKIFDDVIASDETINLKGKTKLSSILEYTKGDSFSYAGDSKADYPIWDEAASNVFVNAPSEAVQKAEKQSKAEKVISTRKLSTPMAFLKSMRPHQWAKNVLIFTAIFTAHEYQNINLILIACIAFIAFSLCASGVYFLNDLLDLENDRLHKTKKFRPLAAAELSIPLGVFGAIILPIIAFTISVLYLPTTFVLILGGYFLLTNIYSFFIKNISTADVMTLALLYTLRVIAGAEATQIYFSSWLMAFSVFIFSSLAYLKRYVEIAELEDEKSEARGRGYTYTDCETMFTLGASNITAAVLVLALYVNSEEVIENFKTPDLLWALCFLLLYWGNRIWIGARRGKIHEDPVVFVAKDKVNQIIAVAFIGVVIAAKVIEF